MMGYPGGTGRERRAGKGKAGMEVGEKRISPCAARDEIVSNFGPNDVIL